MGKRKIITKRFALKLLTMIITNTLGKMSILKINEERIAHTMVMLSNVLILKKIETKKL